MYEPKNTVLIPCPTCGKAIMFDIDDEEAYAHGFDEVLECISYEALQVLELEAVEIWKQRQENN